MLLCFYFLMKDQILILDVMHTYFPFVKLINPQISGGANAPLCSPLKETLQLKAWHHAHGQIALLTHVHVHVCV